MDPMTLLLVALLFVILIWAISTYNALVRERLHVKEGWSAVQVQLQRRASLVPNLVETVRGYAGHERQTFDSVIEARSRVQGAAGPADAATANNALTQTLRSLFALAEAYPDLKANQNFLDLQEQLADTEDKISYARNYYNSRVLSYNGVVQMVPSNYVAKLGGFAESEFFEASEEGREEVKVGFS